MSDACDGCGTDFRFVPLRSTGTLDVVPRIQFRLCRRCHAEFKAAHLADNQTGLEAFFHRIELRVRPAEGRA
jgi:hypothetical protein